MLLKLRLRVLQRNRNNTFCLHLYFLSFFLAFARQLNVRDRTKSRILMCPCWWFTGQVGLTDCGTRCRGADPALCCGSVSDCRGPVIGEKRQTFYKCTQNLSFLVHRGARNTTPFYPQIKIKGVQIKIRGLRIKITRHEIKIG